MGERKVLNKYIPADFDPSLVPRGKKLSSKDGCVPVRMMLPFSIQCSNCKTFLYRGRKFNSKKEPMGGPDGRYLGIQRWRFYIKCTHCSRPLSFLTDPKNADYEMESGGTRNYEIHKDKAETEEDAAAEKDQEEKEDPMKALENRVLESQKEMADLDNLEEIKAMNARHVKLMSGKDLNGTILGSTAAADNDDVQAVLLTEEDEALVRSIQFGKKSKIRRLNEEDEKQLEEKRKREAAILEEKQRLLAEKAKLISKQANNKPTIPIIKVKRKRVDETTTNNNNDNKSNTQTSAKMVKNNNGLASLLGGYSSDSSSDDSK